MYRKFYTYLSSKQTLTQEQLNQLSSFLKTVFFREFVSPLDLTKIIKAIEAHEILHQMTIFNQGDSIDKYFFLLSGRVFLKKRTSKLVDQVEVEMIQRVGVLGEFFLDTSNKRGAKAQTIPQNSSTLIFSIDKDIFHEAYHTQIEEYENLKQKVSFITSLSPDTLEAKGLYLSLEWKRFRFGDKITFLFFQDKILNILKGECIFYNNSGSFTMIPGNYLNLENFFNRKEVSTSNYRIITSEMVAVVLPFQFLDKLPKHFKEKLQLLQECRNYTMKEYFSNTISQSSLQSIKQSPKQSRVKYSNNLILPKVEKNFSHIKTSDSQLQTSLIKNISPRASNNYKIQKSMSILNTKPTFEQNLDNFRKNFCLSYSKGRSLQLSPSKEIREPKGYFQMPILEREKRFEINEVNRRQWASYIKTKEQDKKKLRQPQKRNVRQSNKENDRKKGERLKTLFDKFSSNPPINKLGRPIQLKKNLLKPKTKIFQFPIKNQ